jgi:hypothetical protein
MAKKKKLELTELQAFRLWEHIEGDFHGRSVLMHKLWEHFGGATSIYYQKFCEKQKNA